MKHMKKLLAISLAVAMTATLTLAGCSPKENSTATPKEDSTSTEAPKKDAAPVELIWYQFVDNIMPDHDAVIAKLNEYLKEKINATVKTNFLTYDDYQQKMPVIISSGQQYDVGWSTSWMVNYNEYVAKGAFLPIDDLLNEYGKETKEFIPETLWRCMKIDGKMYGVPGYKEAGHKYGLVYNTAMAKEMNLDMTTVKKWSDMGPIMKQVKEQKPDVLGLGDNLYNLFACQEHISGDWTLPGVLNIPGQEVYARTDDKIFNQYDTPEFMEFAKIIREWYLAGYLPKDPANYGNMGTGDLKAEKLFASSIFYSPGAEEAMTARVGHEMAFIETYKPIQETVDLTGGAIHVISQSSKNPEASMKFINLLYTDEVVGTMVRHGIEGVHYQKEGEYLKRLGDIANPKYDYGTGYVFGTIFNQTWTTDFPAGMEKTYLDYNATLTPTTGLGFAFNQNNVKTEVTAISNVMKEFYLPLIGGVIDPVENIPKFNEKLKANGLDTYLAEMQKQFDAWKAAS